MRASSLKVVDYARRVDAIIGGRRRGVNVIYEIQTGSSYVTKVLRRASGLAVRIGYNVIDHPLQNCSSA